jgi:hypothetical protein
MYVIEHVKGAESGTFYVRDIWRVPQYFKMPTAEKLAPVIEYGTRFWPRHYKSEMPALLKMIKRKQWDHEYPVYRGRAFNPKKDGFRDFIIEWEGSVRALETQEVR